MIFIKKSDIMHKISILFFQSVLPVTKNLLEKPDTVEGFLCSFAVSCITVSMCYIGTLIIRTTLIISKKPGNTGISRDIRTEFTTDLLLSD